VSGLNPFLWVIRGPGNFPFGGDVPWGHGPGNLKGPELGEPPKRTKRAPKKETGNPARKTTTKKTGGFNTGGEIHREPSHRERNSPLRDRNNWLTGIRRGNIWARGKEGGLAPPEYT